MKLSIAIPYHGDRRRWIAQTVKNLHQYKQVLEIVITAEPGSEVPKLRQALGSFKKVKITQNSERLFVFRNKINAVNRCSGDWVAIIDSDNIAGHAFINPAWSLIAGGCSVHQILAPEAGLPQLKYKEFSGEIYNLTEATKLLGNGRWDLLMNTMNYIVHRETWLNSLNEAIQSNYDPLTADSAWINFHCLKSGMVIKVVPGMVYQHTVHEGSTFRQYAQDGIREYDKLCKLMKGLVDDPMLGRADKIQAREPSQVSAVSKWATTGRSGRPVFREAGSNQQKESLQD